jgi:hypothetical protein
LAKEKRKSFLLYESQRGLVGLLGEAERAALLSAIYDYVATGEHEPMPSAAAAVAFAAIKVQLDIDTERYEEICESRRAAANARWEKEQKEEKPLPEAPKKEKGAPKTKPKRKESGKSGCKCTYNDADTDADNDADADANTDAERRAKGGGSFDTDAFFEIASQRSFNDEK